MSEKVDRTEKLWYDMEDDGYSLDEKRNFIDWKRDIPDIIHSISELKGMLKYA